MYETKSDWQNLLGDILLPLKPHYSAGSSRLLIGSSGASYEQDTIGIEAFARPLWGLAPLWAGGGSLDKFDEIYRRGIISGTDPKSDEYWGVIHDFDQRMVEMAAFGYALLLAPDKVWEPLSNGERTNFNNWLLQINDYKSHDNNWKFFAVIVNIGLASVGGEYSRETIDFCLKEIESYYIGDGWYSDGKNGDGEYYGARDYYISFAIHFYSLIYAKVMAGSDKERSDLFKERAARFAEDFIYWFAPDGRAVPFGRSMTYRFAQAAFWSACVYADVDVFSHGVIKGLLARHIDDWMKAPIFDNGGVLTIGYRYQNLNMSESYNAPGSPYWALKTFMILALPDDHPFWSAEALAMPALKPLKTLPRADMMVQQRDGESVIYPVGKYSSPGLAHYAEKYSKFAYSSRFGFSVPRSCRALREAAPDSMLAFEIDGYIYVRRGIEEEKITDHSVTTVWSPIRGITVCTEIIPTDNGHMRRHRITSEFMCRAYDCGFALSRDVGQGFRQRIDGSAAAVINQSYKCVARGKSGVGTVIKAFPNTNFMVPETSIPAVCYDIPKGVCEIETIIQTEKIK